jgi:hypothetical protein
MEEKKARYKDWRLVLAGLLLAGLLLGGGYLWGTLTHRGSGAIEFGGRITSMKEISVQLQQGTGTYTEVTFDNGERLLFYPEDARDLFPADNIYWYLKLKATNVPVWRIVGLFRGVSIASTLQ